MTGQQISSHAHRVLIPIRFFFKIPDEHPGPFYLGVPAGLAQSNTEILPPFSSTTQFIKPIFVSLGGSKNLDFTVISKGWVQ